MRDETENIAEISFVMADFFMQHSILIAYPESTLIDEDQNLYSLTYSAKSVNVKDGASKFTIFNKTTNSPAKLDVKYSDRIVSHPFSNLTDLKSILQLVFLDQPSVAITPENKQIIWNSIFRLTSLLEHVSTVKFEHQ